VTLGCREMVPGVPPTIGFTEIPSQTSGDLEIRVPRIIVLTTYGCHQILVSLKGCHEPKKFDKHCLSP
jgi:hypothetical protein